MCSNGPFMVHLLWVGPKSNSRTLCIARLFLMSEVYQISGVVRLFTWSRKQHDVNMIRSWEIGLLHLESSPILRRLCAWNPVIWFVAFSHPYRKKRWQNVALEPSTRDDKQGTTRKSTERNQIQRLSGYFWPAGLQDSGFGTRSTEACTKGCEEDLVSRKHTVVKQPSGSGSRWHSLCVLI